MKVIQGDLLDLFRQKKFDVIIHGCNCFHTFGSGIAKQVREQFPEAYAADCQTSKGDVLKLGSFSSCEVGPGVIINAYTQYGYGKDQRHFEYAALGSVCLGIILQYGNRRLRFGIPKIGAGLGGGHWPLIAVILDRYFRDEDFTLVEYNP